VFRSAIVHEEHTRARTPPTTRSTSPAAAAEIQRRAVPRGRVDELDVRGGVAKSLLTSSVSSAAALATSSGAQSVAAAPSWSRDANESRCLPRIAESRVRA
jgi:hypothetical protein